MKERVGGIRTKRNGTDEKQKILCMLRVYIMYIKRKYIQRIKDGEGGPSIEKISFLRTDKTSDSISVLDNMDRVSTCESLINNLFTYRSKIDTDK